MSSGEDMSRAQFAARWPGISVDARHAFLPTEYQIQQAQKNSDHPLRAAWVWPEGKSGSAPYLAIVIDRRIGLEPMNDADALACVTDEFWSRHGGDFSPVVELVPVSAVVASRRNERIQPPEPEADSPQDEAIDRHHEQWKERRAAR